MLERLIEHVPSDADPPEAAQTWYAVDSVLSRPVIVHVLAGSDPRAGLMLDAARRAATASDVRFLRVLDAAEEDSVAYVVKEWVGGRSLTELLADGPLQPEPAGWIVREVAEALTSLHGQGGAHLRLVPDNIYLTTTGAVRVDGLATDAVLFDVPRPESMDDATRADTRALGMLLYAGLTARWPGAANVDLRTAPRGTDGDALSPRQCRAGVPRNLDAICERVLADSPRGGASLISPLEITAALTDAVGEPPIEGIVVGTGDDAPTQLSAAATATDADATMAIRRDTAPPPSDQDKPAAAAAPAAGGAASSQGLRGLGGAQAATTPPRPRPPAWRRVVAVLVAVVCLGGITLLGWQLAFQGLDNGESPEESAAGPDQSETEEPEQQQGEEADPPPEPIAIQDASDFDPQGSGDERPDDVPNIHDGDPETTWTTLEYYNYPELGLLKDGVGVWMDLGEAQEVSSVDIGLLPGGTDLELRAAPENATDPPGDAAGWNVVSSATDAGEEVTFEPDEPVTTRYLLVWFTKLPPSEGGFRGGISEVSVR